MGEFRSLIRALGSRADFTAAMFWRQSNLRFVEQEAVLKSFAELFLMVFQ
jgi:hypothetical protein